MQWVTRKHAHVNRTATAWLVRRFLDPRAETTATVTPKTTVTTVTPRTAKTPEAREIVGGS